MSKMWKSFGIVLIAIALSACQSGDNSYAVHRSGFDPSDKSIEYQVYPVQSQLTLSIYPKSEGAPAVIRASLEEGNLYVEGGEVRGGNAVANMEKPIVEMPASPSPNTSLPDPLGKKMLDKAGYDQAKLEIARITPNFNEETGSTHLIALNLKLRNKKRGLKVPARIVINQDHIALMSVGMFSIDLTKWGMRPEQEGWQKEAILALQIRGDTQKK